MQLHFGIHDWQHETIQILDGVHYTYTMNTPEKQYLYSADLLIEEHHGLYSHGNIYANTSRLVFVLEAVYRGLDWELQSCGPGFHRDEV